jgi:hypothetical protein
MAVGGSPTPDGHASAACDEGLWFFVRLFLGSFVRLFLVLGSTDGHASAACDEELWFFVRLFVCSFVCSFVLGSTDGHASAACDEGLWLVSSPLLRFPSPTGRGARGEGSSSVLGSTDTLVV